MIEVKEVWDLLEKEEDRLGRCYELAGRWMMSNGSSRSEARLVHGHIVNRMTSGLPELDHAWIEEGDTVWEPTTDKEWDKWLFYEFFNATVQQSYDHEEALVQMLRTEHWGPWK